MNTSVSTNVIAPFKTGEKITAASSGIKSLFAEDAIFVGNIEMSSGLKLDGTIIGDIQIKGENNAWLILNKKALIEGNAEAKIIVVAGCVKGSLKAKYIALLPSAKIEGDMYYEYIRMSDGASVDGKMYRNYTKNTLIGESVQIDKTEENKESEPKLSEPKLSVIK